MEDKQLDKLFKNGLDKNWAHTGAEESWARLQPTLDVGHNRRRAMWTLVLCCIIGLTIFLFNVPKTNSTNRTTSEISQKKSSPTPKKTDKDKSYLPSKSEIENSNGASTTASKFATPLNLKSEQSNTINNTDKIITSKQEERCNCPDDPDYTSPSSTLITTNNNINSYNAYSTQKSTYDTSSTAQNTGTNSQENKEKNINSITPLLKQIPLLSYKKSELLSLLNNPIIIQEKTQVGIRTMSLKGGVLKENQIDNSLDDRTPASYYFGLVIHARPSLSTSLTYYKQNISRTFNEDFPGYGEINPYLPAETTLQSGEITQSRNVLELSFSYNLTPQSKLSTHLIGSTAFYKLSAGMTQLKYAATYGEVLETFDLQKRNWHLGHIAGGMGISYPIINRLEIGMQYHYTIPINAQEIIWKNNHRFMMGLQFNL